MRSRSRRPGIGATLHPHADTLRVMDLGLEGKVALVTGASQGIGFGIARELAREGARVAVSSRTRDKIDAAAAEIGVAKGASQHGEVLRVANRSAVACLCRGKSS